METLSSLLIIFECFISLSKISVNLERNACSKKPTCQVNKTIQKIHWNINCHYFIFCILSFFIFLPHLNTSSHTKVCFILVEPYLVFWNGIAFQLIIIYSKYFVFTVAYLPSWKNFPLCSYWNHSIIRIKFCPFLLEPFKFTEVLYAMLSFFLKERKASQHASSVFLTTNRIISMSVEPVPCPLLCSAYEA